MLSSLFKALFVALLPSQVGAFECSGNFDVFFLLDRSTSMGTNYRSHVIPFTKSVASNFIGENVRIGLITFGNNAELLLDPTADEMLLQTKLDEQALIGGSTTQGTNIGAGLELVKVDNTDKNRIVFLVSDGCDNEWRDSKGRYIPQHTIDMSTKLKSLGVEIYVVYIPLGTSTCPDYLKSIASQPTQERFFPILSVATNREQYFDTLNTKEFIENLIISSCFEIEAVTPTEVCNTALRTMEVYGKGFAAVTDLATLQCKFEEFLDCTNDPPAPYTEVDCQLWAEKGFCNNPEYQPYMTTYCPMACSLCKEPIVFTENAVVLSDTELVCRSPRLGELTNFRFEITRNRMTYTQSDINIATYDCGGEEIDDPTPFDFVSSLRINIRSTPQFFMETTSDLTMGFTVTNNGKVGITGPIVIEILQPPSLLECPPGNLGVNEQIVCESVLPITSSYRTAGQLVVQALARGTFDSQAVESPAMQLTVFNKLTPTPEPTVKPTSAPSEIPTAVPSAAPTSRPTPMPDCATVNNGVALDLSFDEPLPAKSILYGNAAVTDSAGNVGRGLLLSGVADFLDVPFNVKSTDFSIHVSFQATTIQASYVFESGPDSSFTMLSFDDAGQLSYWVTTQDNGGGCAATSSAMVEPDVWYDVVITFQMNEVCRMYVNGVEDVTAQRPTTGAHLALESFHLGARVWEGSGILYHSSYLTGYIDEFIVWDRVLSAGQVEFLFQESQSCLRSKTFVFVTEGGLEETVSRKRAGSTEPKEVVMSGLVGIFRTAVDTYNDKMFIIEDSMKGPRVRHAIASSGADLGIKIKPAELQRPIEMAYDADVRKLYVADNGLRMILAVKYDGTEVVVAARNLPEVQSLVFDRETGVMFVAASGNILKLTNLNGKEMPVVLQQSPNRISGMALADGRLFWTAQTVSTQFAAPSTNIIAGRRLLGQRSLQQTASTLVFSARTDKDAPVSVITLSGVEDAGKIAIDSAAERMYFITGDKVVSVNMDGSDKVDFLTGLVSPLDISTSQVPTETKPPTPGPTPVPSAIPTALPTVMPSAMPTAEPTAKPTAFPTALPTSAPTRVPTTAEPTMPTGVPSGPPTPLPSQAPTQLPTAIPTALPTFAPSALPTAMPSAMPTAEPSAVPSAMPTVMPSAMPTAEPSAMPTAMPSAMPTADPTMEKEDVTIGQMNAVVNNCPDWYWPIECMPWWAFAAAGAVLLLLLICCICCLRRASGSNKHKTSSNVVSVETPLDLSVEEPDQAKSTPPKAPIEKSAKVMPAIDMGELKARLDANNKAKDESVESGSESDGENNNHIHINFATLKKGDLEQFNVDRDRQNRYSKGTI